MTYQESLLTNEWQLKRKIILERDNYKCQNCGIESTKFRGLSERFGILTIEEIKEKGYEPLFQNFDCNDSFIRRSTFIERLIFLGDKQQEFNINDLRFAEQYDVIKDEYKKVYFFLKEVEGKSLIDLNVHHKYYTTGHKSWEYEDDALISLCISCHKKVHEEEDIYVFDERLNRISQILICERCHGSGYLSQYNYYMNGICFQCLGEGVAV